MDFFLIFYKSKPVEFIEWEIEFNWSIELNKITKKFTNND